MSLAQPMLAFARRQRLLRAARLDPATPAGRTARALAPLRPPRAALAAPHGRRPLSSAAAPARAGAGSGMAPEGGALVAAAAKFCRAWGAGDAGALAPLLSDDVTFSPDGVVFQHELRGAPRQGALCVGALSVGGRGGAPGVRGGAAGAFLGVGAHCCAVAATCLCWGGQAAAATTPWGTSQRCSPPPLGAVGGWACVAGTAGRRGLVWGAGACARPGCACCRCWNVGVCSSSGSGPTPRRNRRPNTAHHPSAGPPDPRTRPLPNTPRTPPPRAPAPAPAARPRGHRGRAPPRARARGARALRRRRGRGRRAGARRVRRRCLGVRAARRRRQRRRRRRRRAQARAAALCVAPPPRAAGVSRLPRARPPSNPSALRPRNPLPPPPPRNAPAAA